MAFIYCITNRINNKKYIGKTTLALSKRFREHCCEANKNRAKNRPLYKAMIKYGISNFTIDLLIECDTDDLEFYEILFINKYNTYHNGYNATKGGDGRILFDYDYIVKLYKSGKNIKEVAKEVSCTEDTVIKILNVNNIKRHPLPNVKRGLSTSKPVDRFSLQGNYIDSFDSCSQAAYYIANLLNIKYTKGMSSKISNCAKGKAHTAYKYIWKFRQ